MVCYGAWSAGLLVLLGGRVALQDRSLISSELDVDQAAAALLAGIQGGVSILLSTGQSVHLRAALDFGIMQLRSTGPS